MYLNTPVVKSSKAIPDWWKEIEPYDVNNRNPELMTVRECYGFIELYRHGVIVENWCDLTIKTFNDEYLYWYSGGNAPEFHERRQWGNAFPNHHHLKLNNPWVMREKTGINFMWVGAEWSLDKFEIKVLPGMVRFDIVTGMNVNMMFPKREGEFTIPVGTPLGQLIPLTDKKLRVENHLVTYEEYKQHLMTSMGVSFYGWRKALQLRKRNKERGTCPYHSGDNNG